MQEAYAKLKQAIHHHSVVSVMYPHGLVVSVELLYKLKSIELLYKLISVELLYKLISVELLYKLISVELL